MESKPDWCWLNGAILPLSEARVSVLDRGFIFSDGVYEGIRIANGKPFELPAHLGRLERSCGGIRLPMPLTAATLSQEIHRLVEHSGVREGSIYLQATRGPAPRDPTFPKVFTPTVFFYVQELPALPLVEEVSGYTLLSVPDERWQRCWIKALALLPNVLAKNAAVAAGADEAVFIHNGAATEGNSSNLFMVRDGRLLTHPQGPKVLPGITRQLVLDAANDAGVAVEERAVRLDEAKQSDEVFITSSIRNIRWVGSWDDQTIGDSAGPITRQIDEILRVRMGYESLAPSQADTKSS